MALDTAIMSDSGDSELSASNNFPSAPEAQPLTGLEVVHCSCTLPTVDVINSFHPWKPALQDSAKQPMLEQE